jgi:Trk K+ transport system NAD-binding subunit
VIKRDGEALPPRGSSIVEAGDQLSVLVPHQRLPDLEDVFERWRRLI